MKDTLRSNHGCKPFASNFPPSFVLKVSSLLHHVMLFGFSPMGQDEDLTERQENPITIIIVTNKVAVREANGSNINGFIFALLKEKN